MTTLKHLRALVGLGLLVGACGSADDNRPAEWAYIAPAIIIPNCATSSCHSEAAAASGLDMSTPARAYNSLTGLNVGIFVCDSGDNTEDGKQTCTTSKPVMRPSRALILPGNPGASRTVAMMRARGADRMPPDRPLAEADIALFEEWIALGAHK